MPDLSYYSALKGATITDVKMRPDNEFPGEEWPVLMVRFADGSTGEVEVSRDSEGNGPGFLFGLPVPA